MKHFELLSFVSADELARAAADAWLDEIKAANCAGKTYCVALSGGRIVQKFFTATVELAEVRNIGDAARRPSRQRPFFLGGRALRAAHRS